MLSPSHDEIARIDAMSVVEVGISGWTYKGWRGSFYPKSLSHKRELEYASREFPTIEINGTFYSLQRPQSYQHWYEATPEGFVFSLKGNRFITHVKRLKDINIPLANFFASGPLVLKEKLGPILWQFPPSMTFDPERFENFMKVLPTDFNKASEIARRSQLAEDRKFLTVSKNYRIRHAIEVRNISFYNPWFIELLRKYNVAIVFAETAGKWPYIEDITADFIYVRLHGDIELYVSGHDDESLNFWAKRIKKWQKGLIAPDQHTLTDDRVTQLERDVFVYFDNDAKVKAPLDAKSLIRKLGQGK